MLDWLRRLLRPSQNDWPRVGFEEIRRRARLLVIDDQEFPYIELFQRDGYTLTKWPDVKSLSDLQDGNYDLVLLDLQGVGRQEAHEQQGFGVLKHLREQAPTLIVVAYSNADWSLKYQEFFKLADGVLPKTADYVDFKSRVDELLKQRFSLGFHLDRIMEEAKRENLDSNRVHALAQQAILRRDPKKLEAYLENARVSTVTITRILTVVKSAIEIWKVWNAH